MQTSTVLIVTLFTPAEDVVLAKWLQLEPATEAAGMDVDAALTELGFTDTPGFYSIIDAAVAHILLEGIEARLPQWAAVYFSPEGGQIIELARQYRDPDGKPLRKVSLVPRHLFTINWADSGPGMSWPVQYRLVWVPYYERWVVTASADSPDAHGYCDFAIGSFARNKPIEDAVGNIVKGDWSGQFAAYDQQRWAYLFDTGLISQRTAEQWTDEVWGAYES